MRPEAIFKVEPYGGKWAVVCEDEPLVVTETEADAARLAQGALVTLAPARPPRPSRPAAMVEPRSFSAESDDGPGPFGFPVTETGDGR
ncbi:hypothetical protein [Phenylobacterium kunshanense]|uniref:Uncharacterized protein n=1 Tax=Phenylobacterium kunshanense TaxID=1445034 RepID=A0A328BJY1_9CAUL|nr:hypothetical protein [Phenylobacterium kunshanense]RAK67630.1 hypothetical protein DJ019_06915 [Phenylobacterium kunshanense]